MITLLLYSNYLTVQLYIQSGQSYLSSFCILTRTHNNNNNNNNNNLFLYSALFNMLSDQKRITTINNLKTIQILEVYKYI